MPNLPTLPAWLLIRPAYSPTHRAVCECPKATLNGYCETEENDARTWMPPKHVRGMGADRASA